MAEITWTQDELDTFDRLIDMVNSRNQVQRINGRFDMKVFVDNHGKEKCDAMFAHLQEKENAG